MKQLFSDLKKAIAVLGSRKLTIESDSIPYRFENLSYKKIFNAFLTEASNYFRPKKAWGMPTHMMVEPSTFCNLRCTLCPVTIGLDRPTGNMEMDIFKKLIQEVGEYIFTLLLWDWGEPFMNPRIYDMITLAKEHNIKTITSTNGHIFENKEHADRVIRSGLDTVIFAIDGIHQDTYEIYRQGGKLQSALKGIENIVAGKRELNSKTPYVVFRFIVMGQNEHEIPQLKKLAESLGVDALALKTLNAASQDPYFVIESPKREDYKYLLPENIKYRRFKFGPEGLQSIRLKRNPCRNMWNTPCVHWNGTITPCTYDPRDQYVLGDLRKNSFKEIWNGKEYRKMRKQFRSEWEKINLCTECSYAFKGGDCSRETTAEVYFYGDPDIS